MNNPGATDNTEKLLKSHEVFAGHSDDIIAQKFSKSKN